MTPHGTVTQRRRRLAAALLMGTLSLGLTAAPGDEVPGPGEPGGPTHELEPDALALWLAGRAVFDRNFHRSEGVGTPDFNADSCRACHEDPVLGGAGGLELNVSRFGRDNGGLGPFQDLEGGQALSKLRPPWEHGRENYDPGAADVFEQRQTPSLLGGGLIDSVSQDEILSREDPGDRDGDGVRGVARMLMVEGELEVGRFGWKAQVPTLADFVRDGMANELGITTLDDGRGFALESDADDVGDPELSPQDLQAMHHFLSLLGPPLRRSPRHALVLQGEEVFHDLGCARCHVPVLKGADGPVPLFSDLLLHDVMGPDFRGMAEPGAEVGMYRTPPLWGVRDTAPYLHDGRAETLQQAIEMHQGEALLSAQTFALLPEAKRQALLRFLLDL